MIIRANAQIGADLFDEIVVDNFAGGGGASMGIETALGRSVDVAINHNAEAIATHRINHPHTRHITSDVWEVDPAEVAAGRRIGLAWFSPDCTFFSKARGGKPIRDPAKKSRALAWVVIRWAALPADVRPRVVILENVEEFQHWGPLDPGSGKPCPKRKGKTFRSWTGKLRGLGYDVQWKELRACDYGAPTIRKRLFLVARCDGLPIVWPPPEYGDVDCQDADAGRNNSVDRRSRDRRGGVCHPRCSRGIDLKPYRTAAECIDWSIPCPSIFERIRPLADNTLKRIARAVHRLGQSRRQRRPANVPDGRADAHRLRVSAGWRGDMCAIRRAACDDEHHRPQRRGSNRSTADHHDRQPSISCRRLHGPPLRRHDGPITARARAHDDMPRYAEPTGHRHDD
jgi:DNA (cytosine-5)-methyltransferase 1